MVQGADITFENVARRFGRRWAVAGVSFAVKAGEGVALTGHNGSGKSTLLRCLATALKVHHGRILVDGQPLWDNRHTLRPRICMLSHAGALYDDLSGEENLRVWARLGGHTGDLPALLDRVGLAGRKEPVRTYSAGMRRRLALARLILHQPGVVLLDEPYTALDAKGRALVTEVATALRAEGATVFMATHLMDYARHVCDRRIELLDGEMVSDGEVPR
ncbi:MAG: heme ABC exporter ATP-binding protein CcmA [Myxococcales bacterium]|nr:heme ABC exporter ATP-binding protein CcmA [Myxococcales bacterium]MCB9668621.1 heme ABC exporter ATP-binding protein CcmA [Alphaproteobacteria bacterium]MCB9690861.1 heme ABC exporter ATP-binding protein CcmA [Alphaproteobacteria bacterium]